MLYKVVHLANCSIHDMEPETKKILRGWRLYYCKKNEIVSYLVMDY